MKLLALVESPDHVCCRYRIRAFAPALQKRVGRSHARGWIEGTFVGRSSFAGRGQFDAVILQRKLLPSWQLSAPAPLLAPAGLRLRRRGPVPRFVRSPRAAQPLGDRGGSPRRSARPTRSSPATTSLRTAALRAGARSSGSM